MSAQPHVTGGTGLARKIAFLGLVLLATGIPANGLFGFAILVFAAILVFTGETVATWRAWLLALGLCAATLLTQALLSTPRIEEGHNVFLAGNPSNALTTGLPPDVYRQMAAQFDALYPPDRRCDPKASGCWRTRSYPDTTFAFSADGLFDRPEMSRRVDSVDFADPVWLRLGFINDIRYNWITREGDVDRAYRDRRFWMGLHRWHLTMPYFVMYRFPADFAGGQLCWRGDVIWEERAERFTLLSHPNWGCRALERADAGIRIFGLGIKPGTLAMSLDPPITILLKQWAHAALTLALVGALLGLLVRWRKRSIVLPIAVFAACLLVIAVDDASFIGGVRPFDGGDDGLYYDGVARQILVSLLNGNVLQAIEGGEKVFYYGGPGFRYLRALEHVVFGESYLGYLALILLLPIAVFGLFNRFVPRLWALASLVVFVAIPAGALFGTTFFQYAKTASRGYADPAAAMFALCGTLFLVGLTSSGPGRRFGPAFGAAFLFALAIFVRPNLAPFVAIMLAGATIAALFLRQWARVSGLCLGFLPAAFMPWHNWYFGNVFVLLSANAEHPQIFLMPPSSYVAALGELVRFDLSGSHLAGAVRQIANWLSGPSELYATIPLNAAAVAIVVFAALRGRAFDRWLRLLALACLAQHGVMLVYATTPRYHFFTWLMTLVVVTAWIAMYGVVWVRARCPGWWERAARHPWTLGLAAALARLDAATGGAEPDKAAA